MSYILHNAHWFVLLIGALVIIHELGHFLVAKACGVRVLRFSVGMGPRIFSLQAGETEYQISLLPIGGYVKMLGESPDGEDGETDELSAEEAGRSFAVKPLWQRTAIILAGPVFNFILALGVYMVMFHGTHQVGDTRLGIVTPGGPAALAGVLPGDRVLAINDEPVTTWDALRDGIAGGAAGAVRLDVERQDGRHRLLIQPADDGGERRRVGISLQYIAPVLGLPDPASPAARAGLREGDEVVQVGERTISAWYEVREAVARSAVGEALWLHVRRPDAPLPHAVMLLPEAGYPAGIDPTLLSAADPAGAYTGLVAREVQVSEIEAGSPAAAAGLLPGDRLLSVGVHGPAGAGPRRPVHVWSIDMAGLAVGPDSSLDLTWQRGRQVLNAQIRLAEHKSIDEMREEQVSYILGASHDTGLARTYTALHHTGPAEAVARAGRQVAGDMTLVVRALSKLVSGDIPFKQVGGPIMLFVIAEKSAKRGAEFFARTLAMVSVNIGLMNLLPVPSLDGGHLVFLGLEAVSRRRPSLRVRELANVVGLVLLIILMAMVFRNDVLRFVF